MKKKIIKSLILFFLSGLVTSSKASLLWNFDIALDEFKNKNYNFCIDYLKEYIQSNPNDKEGYYLLAMAYKKTGDEKFAIENFKKAYELTLNEKNIQKIDFNIDTNSNIEDYFDMAAAYFEAGDLKEADFYADMMLKINPKSSVAYFIKAKIAKISGNENKAFEYINKALIYNPKLINTNLAKSLNANKEPEASKEMYGLFAYEAYFSGDIVSSIKYIQKYLKDENEDIDSNCFLAELYLKNEQIDEAKKIIDEIFNLNDKYIQAYIIKAKIHYLNKEFEQYKLTLERALEINPNNHEILLKLGNSALLDKEFIKSRKYFDTLVNINDNCYEAYFGLIYSLIELGELDEAMLNLRKLTAIDKESSECDFLLAKICEKSLNYTESLDYIKEALRTSENGYYYLEEAKINYMLKKYNSSIESLNEAQKTPQNSMFENEIYLFKTFNYLKLNDRANACKFAENALKKSLDKNTLMYKYNLYVIYKLQGDDKKASYELAQIKKTKPEKISDCIDLSEIYYEIYGLGASIKVLDNAIAKTPINKSLYYQKIKLYYLSGEEKKIKETVEVLKKLK